MHVIDKIAYTEMREWLLECFPDEYDQEVIGELTYDELVNGINKYYDGGYVGFLDDMVGLDIKRGGYND